MVLNPAGHPNLYVTIANQTKIYDRLWNLIHSSEAVLTDTK